MHNQSSTSKLVHSMRFMIRLHRSQLWNDDELPEYVADDLARKMKVFVVAHRTGNEKWFAQHKGKGKASKGKGKGKHKGKKGGGKWHSKGKSSSSSGWW